MEMQTYKKLEFSKWNPPATAEQIAATEREISGTFPSDYREFLMNINGGLIRTDPSFIASSHRRSLRIWTLKDLFGVKPCSCAYITKERFSYDFIERVPALIIPIGVLEADYRICLSLRTRDYGHVYMWGPRHLWPFDDELPNKQSMKDLFFIAKGFTEFLELLKPKDELEAEASS